MKTSAPPLLKDDFRRAPRFGPYFSLLRPGEVVQQRSEPAVAEQRIEV